MHSYSRRPSLELSWLPISDRKTLPTPRITFMDLDWCGGCYCARGLRFDDMELTGNVDTIVVSTHFGEVKPSVLAHEFRHMQQHYLPSLPRIFAAPTLDFSGDKWEGAIRRFYRGRPYEADALRYERRLAPDHANERAWQVAFVL